MLPSTADGFCCFAICGFWVDVFAFCLLKLGVLLVCWPSLWDLLMGLLLVLCFYYSYSFVCFVALHLITLVILFVW